MTDIPEDALLAAYKIADVVHKTSCHAWVPEAAIDAIARAIMEARDKALEDAAGAAYRTCAETRHVTLGLKAASAIRAMKSTDVKEGK